MGITVDERYRINIFLDTNILVDFLDGTFHSLNGSIEYLKSSSFTSLKSSNYVIYELVEVRKREHFLRLVVEKRLKDNVSISKLVGKKGVWEFDSVKYSDYKEDVQAKIDSEKELITNDLSIDWKNNILHDGLLKPSLELCLESTISREDSLVLLSCAYPCADYKEQHIILLTRDRLFVKGALDPDIPKVFIDNNLVKPDIIKAENIECGEKVTGVNQKLDLYKQVYAIADIEKFWIQKLKELIIAKNSNEFLGKTYSLKGGGGGAAKCVFFTLGKGLSLPKDVSLTIIGKDLDFIYHTRSISEFWNNVKIDNYPFVNNANDEKISFKAYDTDDDGKVIDFKDKSLLDLMQKDGNLVFINNL